MNNKIAIIGWGSLIWDPDCLKIAAERWFQDGPLLPIEFLRRSGDGRVTLVICDEYLDRPDMWVKTYWNHSTLDSLEAAKSNLQAREKMPNQTNIGYYFNGQGHARHNQILTIVTSWAKAKDLAGVIWTDLDKNLREAEVLPYLRNLNNEVLNKARNYVVKAPLQVNTPLRDRIQHILNWMPEALY